MPRYLHIPITAELQPSYRKSQDMSLITRRKGAKVMILVMKTGSTLKSTCCTEKVA